MKILFCSTAFENQVVGPAVFLHALYEYTQKNQLDHQLELRILTEDVDHGKATIYPLTFNFAWPLAKIGMLSRAWYYHQETQKIRQEYAFTHLVFSDPILAYFSARHRVDDYKVICFVNDDNNLFPKAQRSLGKKLIRLLYRQIQNRVTSTVDLVIINSEYLGRLLRKKSATRRLGLLRKGVDITRFQFDPSPEIPTKRATKVLFIKKDFVRGGVYVLLPALAMITDRAFKLTIVGISDELSQKVKAEFTTLNLSIETRASCTRDEVVTLMQTHHLFCVPSFREALGVSNLEALACGLPVISTTVGGIPEAMNNGEVAWLCPAGDPVALKETIIKCLENKAERNKKVHLGRQWVEAHFEISLVCENFFSILKNEPAK